MKAFLIEKYKRHRLSVIKFKTLSWLALYRMKDDEK